VPSSSAAVPHLFLARVNLECMPSRLVRCLFLIRDIKCGSGGQGIQAYAIKSPILPW
jgi:hypothetical protein